MNVGSNGFRNTFIGQLQFVLSSFKISRQMLRIIEM